MAAITDRSVPGADPEQSGKVKTVGDFRRWYQSQIPPVLSGYAQVCNGQRQEPLV